MVAFDNALAYEMILRARRADEALADAVRSGSAALPIHLSIGQEAISVGACMALMREDVAFGTYRGHALYLSKGGDIKKMFAECYGKSTGCAKGKGGSMHLVDIDAGVMGMSAIVGTGIPNATGYALAVQYNKMDKIVLNMFGDGATEEGVFHESLNFASLKKLPILYLCENNLYAINTHQSARQSVTRIAERVASSYGIRAHIVKDNNTLAVFEAVRNAREDIRSGAGPVFLECMTYRWRQHLGPNGDFGLGGRDINEAGPWMDNDELRRFGGMLAPEVKQRIDAKIKQEIREAMAFADQSAPPAPEELLTEVFAE